MALTDIVAPPGKPSVLNFTRGNGGILEDIQVQDENVFELPEVVSGGGGGNIFIMSE